MEPFISDDVAQFVVGLASRVIREEDALRWVHNPNALERLITEDSYHAKLMQTLHSVCVNCGLSLLDICRLIVAERSPRKLPPDFSREVDQMIGVEWDYQPEGHLLVRVPNHSPFTVLNLNADGSSGYFMLRVFSNEISETQCAEINAALMELSQRRGAAVYYMFTASNSC